MPQIRIVLADDHDAVRACTRRILEQRPDLEVVAEAGDGLAALDLIERLRPDVVVLDIQMPGLNGIEVARRLKSSVPSIRTVVLTAHNDDDFVFALLDAGVSGYLLKTAPARELVAAIRAVHGGELVFQPAITRKVTQFWLRGRRLRNGMPPSGASERWPVTGLDSQADRIVDLSTVAG